MRASIIIPVHNGGRTIAQTARACLEQDFPAEEFEVIVVDDGSTDDTVKQLRPFPVQIIAQANAGVAVARNAGASRARGAVLLFLDADCAPPKDALSRLVSEVEENSHVGLVGGIYASATDSSVIARAINEEIRYRHMRGGSLVHHVGGFCMTIPADLFEAIGGFDSHYLRAQDHELCAQVSNEGREIRVIKEVAFAHNHSRTLGEWLRNQYLQAHYRSSSVIRHSAVLGSDGYVNHRDWFSLLLGALTIGLLPIIWLPRVLWVFAGAVTLSAALHVPAAAFAIRDTGDWRQAVIVPIQVLRGVVWALGAASGLLARVSDRLKGCAPAETQRSGAKL